MQIAGDNRHWDAEDEAQIETVLKFRDAVGGGLFWLSVPDEEYPALAIRISGDVGDVHYFPGGGHPGYRALASRQPGDPDGHVLFRYEGADPASGEEVSQRFVLPCPIVVGIAQEFFSQRSLPASVTWFEL
jgi:hypothetical protein